MTGILPKQLLWRSGKAHHGWRFNEALMDRWEAEFPFDEDKDALLARYARAARAVGRLGDNSKRVDRQRHFGLVVLTSWLRRNQRGGESLTRDGE